MNFSRRALLGAGVFLLSCLVVLSLSVTRAFNDHEALLYDLRFSWRPALKTAPEIVLIEVSDDTLGNLGVWPLPRDFHATLVDVLKELGAKKIVFDILFSEPTLYDAAFARAIQEAGNVYLPLAFTINENKLSKNGLPEASHVLADLVKTLSEGASGTGHINVFLDSDGKIRKVPLFIKFNGHLVPQLGFKAACDTLGLVPEHATFYKDRVVIDNKISIPVMGAHSFLVNYPAKWQESFKHFSYFEILKSYAQVKEGKKPDLDLSQLRNKVFFIGLTATGTSDFRAVPLENIYPLVGLQASVYNSVVNQQFITPVGDFPNAGIALFIFMMSLAMCLRLSPSKALAGSLILGTAYFIISTGLFIFVGIWMDLFLPLFIVLAVYMSLTAARFFIETKKRVLLEKELEIAQAIQNRFLPQGEVVFNGLDIASFIQPAKFVAGDLFDIVKIDDRRLGLFIGDVSGKGVPASLIMAQIISLFRIFARQTTDCANVLSLINQEVAGRISSRFVTCMYVIVDKLDHKACAASAGHAPLFLYKNKTGAIVEVELNAGLPLGITEEVSFGKVLFDMEVGDKILIFTDGLSEARNARREEFGADRIKKIFAQNGTKKAGQIVTAMAAELAQFTLHCRQHDDITLIIVGK